MFLPQRHSCKIERFHLRDSLSRADLGVGRGGPGPPFCGLLNISALHFQYEIQAFAKFKRPECTRLHLGEFHSQKFSWSSMRPPRKVRRSQSHRSKTQILFQSNHYSCTPRKRTRPIFCIAVLKFPIIFTFLWTTTWCMFCSPWSVNTLNYTVFAHFCWSLCESTLIVMSPQLSWH